MTNIDDLIERLRYELKELCMLGEDAPESLVAALDEAIATLYTPLPDEVAEASTWLREKCGGVGNKVADLIERLAISDALGRKVNEELRARIEELEKWNAEMVEKAAGGGTLDGYRDMGQKLATTETKLEAALAGYKKIVERVNKLAFEMKPPNEFTPRFVQLSVEIQAEAQRIRSL